MYFFQLIGAQKNLIDPIAQKLAKGATYNGRDYIVPCNATLHNLKFTFGEFEVVLTPDDYRYFSGVSNL